MYRVFLVEDDQVIAQAVKARLEAWDMQVQCAGDFQDVLGQFVRFRPHLVLMDVKLPYFSGYHWCAQIRACSGAPVVFLSSASDNMNILMALSMGGDDFIAKPFDLDVLVAKVQATLRRAYDLGRTRPLLEHRGAVLDLGEATLSYQGKTVSLTKNDLRILQTLLERKGQVISRAQLMEKLWNTDCFIDDNTLTVSVARLRRKLEEMGLEDFILTRKGLGYMAP